MKMSSRRSSATGGSGAPSAWRRTRRAESGSDDALKLDEQIGLIRGISLIAGIVIGSGIFISPAFLTYACGSVGLSLLMWAFCGLVSTLGALCYAELGTLIPESGGGYSYLYHSYGSLPAYLLAWVYTVALRPAGLAIVGLTCASYLITPAFSDGCGEPPNVIVKLTTAFFVVSLLAVNIHSVRMATAIQVIFMLLKLIPVGLIIIGGIVKLVQGNTEHLATGFSGTTTDVGNISIAIYAGMWSYEGWNSLNDVTEEIKNPDRNLPRSIIIGLPLVTVIYVLMNISYFTVLSPEEVIRSPTVAVSWAEKVIPSVPWLIPICVALSSFGSLNGGLFIGPRLQYVAARNSHMLSLFSMINVKHGSPAAASIFTCGMALIFIIPGEIESLMSLLNFTVWIFHALVASSLIYFRKKRKSDYRAIKVPLFIPIFVMLVSTFLVVIPLVMKPNLAYLYSILFFFIGLLFYIPFVHYDVKFACMDKLTAFFQILLESSPPKLS